MPKPARRRCLAACTLEQLARVERVERTGTPYDGGMRRRMKLVLNDGDSVIFLVRNLDDTIKRLSAAIAGH